MPRSEGALTAPSSLLAPDERVTPCWGRRDELDALRGWCAAPDRPLLVLSGPAGAGKTRLVVELAAAGAEGWKVLRVTNPTVGGEAALVDALQVLGEPTVIVVDLKQYPWVVRAVVAGGVTRRAWLAALLDQVTHTRGRIKVLVECRGTAWQDTLRRELGDQAALLDAAPLVVGPVGSGDDLLRWLNDSAAKAAGRAALAPPPPVLRGPAAGTTMRALHAEAVVVAFGGPASSAAAGAGTPASTERVANYLLGVERGTWHLPTSADGDDTPGLRAVCLLTLVGATDEDDAARVLLRVPDLADSDAGRRTLARAIQALYPGTAPDEWVGRVEPDLISHALHALLLTDPALESHLTEPDLTPRQVNRVLRALVPALAAFPALTAAVSRVLAASPLHAIPDTITIALYLDEARAADRALAAYLASHPPASADLDTIEPLLGSHLVNSRAAVAEIRVDHARAAGDKTALAAGLGGLAFALDRAGRSPEVLAVGEEAVALLRELAAGNAEYRGNLAIELRGLAAALHRAGRYDEMLAAVEEAVALLRELAAGNPAEYDGDLAIALRGVAVALGRAGRYDEMLAADEEAVALLRKLAAGNPARYDGELAFALRGLGVALSRASRYDEALAADEEAVALLRELDTEHSAVYRGDLATALRNQAIGLHRVGRHDEALAAQEEAVALLRELAAGNPAVYRGDLATALRNQAVVLERVGRREDALATYREAAQHFHEAARSRPHPYASEHAKTLRMEHELLRAMGRDTDEDHPGQPR